MGVRKKTLVLFHLSLLYNCIFHSCFYKTFISFFIGLVARQRKQELARLNDQLRQINTALRKQANREEYHTSDSHHAGQGQEAEVVVDPRKEQVLANLRSGKIYLRNQDPEKAFLEFKAGFELADSLGDHTEKKKAARGLGLFFPLKIGSLYLGYHMLFLFV